VRHVDAGYVEAKAFAEKAGVKIPMGKSRPQNNRS
jgi:urocanate hydratase